MNVVIAGHIDHGKSTLIGRLLYDSGNLPESRLSEMQAMCQEYKKKFEFSSFLDAFSDEIKEERTIGTTEVIFKGKYLHTLIDVPGHLEFIEAMLTGASHAEAAIVVVDVTKGLEEQTKRHLNLIRLLGIRNIIIVVNKMDLVNHNLDALDPVVKQMFALGPGLEAVCWSFVPISALTGENVYNRSNKYGERILSLVETLDLSSPKEKRPQSRFIVQGTYEGKVLGSGTLEVGSTVRFSPSGYMVEVLEVDDTGAITLSGSLPQRGEVGSSGVLKTSCKFQSKIFVLAGVIRVGGEFELRCGTASVKCIVSSIDKRLSSETVKELPVGPLRGHDFGILTLCVEPIVVERFEDDPELGRLILSRKGKNVAIGVVLSYE